MGNGKITRKLKELGLKINGVEPKGDTTSEIIKGIADDYAGGGSGGSTYTHYVKVTIMDSCGAEQEIILIITKNDDNPITTTTEIKALMKDGYQFSIRGTELMLNDNVKYLETIDASLNSVFYRIDRDSFQFGYLGQGKTYTLRSVVSDTIKQ